MASELEIVLSCSRLESYQILRTRERFCSSLGKKAMRIKPASNGYVCVLGDGKEATDDHDDNQG